MAEAAPERWTDDAAEAARTCELVTEILTARARGNRDPLLGNSDDDLLSAIEEAEGALFSLKDTLNDG